ncbi:MAG TPA: hypothetical protein DGT23_20245 [Micromonosporaceae bacterium]|nr:hypothetical protein [Micromonosporaceae bacterium]
MDFMNGLRRMLGGLAMVVTMVLLSSGTAYAAVSPNGTYSNWNWPATSTGFYNFDQRLTILNYTAGSNYFWAHQFGFVGGENGYLGLQVGSYPNRTKIALFSIWGANAASGPNCGPFTEGANGYTCRIDPYNWVTGRAYRLRVWVLSTEAAGEWWGAWVQDTVTGTDTYVGKIRVPAAWGRLKSWSVSWTEYFGPSRNTCSEFPWAYAAFTFPTANAGAVAVASHSHYIGAGSCPAYSRIVDYGAELHEQGKLR